MLFASNGKAVRFAGSTVRPMGRTATGVRGMRLEPGEEVCSLIVVDGEGDILTASERGYGKRTPEADYPRKGRGTKGVIARSEEHTSELQSLMRISYGVLL